MRDVYVNETVSDRQTNQTKQSEEGKKSFDERREQSQRVAFVLAYLSPALQKLPIFNPIRCFLEARQFPRQIPVCGLW